LRAVRQALSAEVDDLPGEAARFRNPARGRSCALRPRLSDPAAGRLDSFERLTFPELAEQWIAGIKRSDINDLTAGIAENHKRVAERH
jgi:hypothetical protein